MGTMDLSTAILIMCAAATVLMALACFVYRRRDCPSKNYASDRSDESELFRENVLSEEDQLMIPMDRDTIDDLKRQLSEVSVANVRYIQIGVVEKAFRTKGGLEAREFLEGDVITFRDIAVGFIDGVPADKRPFIVSAFCAKQLKIAEVTDTATLSKVIVFVCKLVLKARFKGNVAMRDAESEEFTADLVPIAEWMWKEKMRQRAMDIESFAQNMSA